MFITRKHLARRTFLKGLGATVALPLLDAMIPAFASNVKQPPRLGFVYVPHGMVMNRFTPKTTGKGFVFETRFISPSFSKSSVGIRFPSFKALSLAMFFSS